MEGPHGFPGDAAPEHRAPPAWRPLSALAVTALVLAVFGGVFSLSGFWWLPVPGLLLGVFAWSRLASGTKRGRGIALTAAILALVAGGVAFSGHRALTGQWEAAFEPLVRALARGDREELAHWVGPPEKDPGRFERWTGRMAAGQAEVGAYAGRVEIGSVWMGALASLVALPRDVREVEPVGPKAIEPGQAFWIRTHCERGTLWLAVVPEVDEAKSSDPKALLELVQPMAENPKARTRVGDVRVFVPVAGTDVD